MNDPDSGKYGINFELLEDTIDESNTTMLRILRKLQERKIDDIERCRERQVAAVNKFAQDKIAEITRK